MSHTRMLGMVAVLLATFAVAPLPARAALGTEVIGAFDATTGGYVVMNADGSSPTVVGCGGDITPSSPRYFLRIQTAPTGNELRSYSFDCQWNSLLVDDPAYRFVFARWSPNGAQIAFSGRRSGTDAAAGLFVGDVNYDLQGRPAKLSNIRLVVPEGAESNPSWSGDSRYLAYHARVAKIDGSSQLDLFVVDTLLAPAPLPLLTTAPTPIPKRVTCTESYNEQQPAFSPSTNAPRLAFIRQTSSAGAVRNDIYAAVWQPSQDSCAVSDGATAVTSKRSANLAQIARPVWSPDGLSLAFDAWSLSLNPTDGADVYRIASDGSGKAKSLTGWSKDTFVVNAWRG